MSNLIGQVFGDLTVIEKAKSTRKGRATWLCQCKCGNTVTYITSHLTRKTNPVKSCGCRKRRRGKDNPLWDGVGDISGAWWSRITREIFGKTNRFRLNVEITKEYAWKLYLEQDGKCALSGIPISIGFGPNDAASLDRIDNAVGYVPGNVQWVHKDINFMKRNFSERYFIALCKAVAHGDGLQVKNHNGVCAI